MRSAQGRGEVCQRYGISDVVFKPAECIFNGKVTSLVAEAIGNWKGAHEDGALSSEFFANPWLVVSRELGSKYPEPQVLGAHVGGGRKAVVVVVVGATAAAAATMRHGEEGG